MTEKSDQVVGLVTVSIAGLTATLAPSDAAVWGGVLMDLAPLGLITFLIWRIRQMDRDLKHCREQHSKVDERLQDLYHKLLRLGGRENE